MKYTMEDTFNLITGMQKVLNVIQWGESIIVFEKVEIFEKI